MFGSSIRVLESPGQLTVINPLSFGLLLTMSFFTALPLLWVLLHRPLRTHRAILLAIVTLIVFAVFPSSSRLTLDRNSGTATLRSLFLYHWMVETVPLDQIDNASVRTGDLTSQIQIQYKNGSVHELSELNQAGGKDEAVYAINQFLKSE